MNIWMNKQMDEFVSEWMEGQMDELMNEWMNSYNYI